MFYKYSSKRSRSERVSDFRFISRLRQLICTPTFSLSFSLGTSEFVDCSVRIYNIDLPTCFLKRRNTQCPSSYTLISKEKIKKYEEESDNYIVRNRCQQQASIEPTSIQFANQQNPILKLSFTTDATRTLHIPETFLLVKVKRGSEGQETMIEPHYKAQAQSSQMEETLLIHIHFANTKAAFGHLTK